MHSRARSSPSAVFPSQRTSRRAVMAFRLSRGECPLFGRLGCDADRPVVADSGHWRISAFDPKLTKRALLSSHAFPWKRPFAKQRRPCCGGCQPTGPDATPTTFAPDQPLNSLHGVTFLAEAAVRWTLLRRKRYGGHQLQNLLDQLYWRETDQTGSRLSPPQHLVDVEDSDVVLDFTYRYLEAHSLPPTDDEVHNVTATIARYKGPRVVPSATLESFLAGLLTVQAAQVAATTTHPCPPE
jgi:hypothetical protein